MSSGGGKKPDLTLDFGSTARSTKFHFNESWTGVPLDSTDAERFKIDTPEIERMLARHGQTLSTPTPSLAQQPISGRNFTEKRPDEVTQEQKLFALGFENALENVRSRSESVSSSSHDDHLNNNNTVHQPMHPQMPNSFQVDDNQQNVTQLSGLNEWNVYEGTRSSSGNRGRSQGSTSSTASSSSHSSLNNNHVPIDMHDQEKIKLERKRLRNRIAASKCRRRKLEKISKLEDKVKHIKGENTELSMNINALRQKLMQLKQECIEHAKHGCQISTNLSRLGGL